MSTELVNLTGKTLSGSQLSEAMSTAGLSKKDVAALMDVSLKTVYNLIAAESIRGPYRLACYTIFPGLRPAD